MKCPILRGSSHLQRVDRYAMGMLKTVGKIIRAIRIEQETQRSFIHPVDRNIPIAAVMQSPQHRAIATQSNDVISFIDKALTIQSYQVLQGLLCVIGLSGNEMQLCHYA